MQFTAWSTKRIAILSNSFTSDYSFSDLSTICIDKIVCMKRKEKTSSQKIQVTQTTSRNTCAELETRSDGDTRFRSRKSDDRENWVNQGNGCSHCVDVGILDILLSVAEKLKQINKKKKFDDLLNTIIPTPNRQEFSERSTHFNQESKDSSLNWATTKLFSSMRLLSRR